MRGFRVPIGLHDWTVKFRAKVQVEGETCNGSCDYDAKVIEIRKDDRLDVQVTTYWHEFMHALLHEIGADTLADDEAFVDTCAQNITRAVRALPDGFY